MSAQLEIQTTTTGGAAARSDLRATRSELSGFGKDTKAAGTEASRSSGRLAGFGSKVGLLARGFAAAGVAAGTGLVLKFGSDALKAASDTQQAFGAVDSVFGRNAARVKAWANSAANDVGLARSEYANMAAVLGSSLKNTGIDNYAAKTHDLIKLGGDLAATYGGTTADAVEALSSLLRGETDPIERYGVSINQTKVNALLASQGLSKLKGSALTAAQQQARLTLLTQQSAAAQGQFARESDTLAGSQQRLGARWTNLKDTLGQKLLPIGTKVVSWLLSTINGSNRTAAIARKVGQVYGSYLAPILKGAQRAISIVAQAFQDSSGKGDGLGKTVRALGRFIAAAAPVLGKIFGGALVVVAKGLGNGIRNVNNFINAVRRIASFVREAASAIGDLAGKLSRLPTGAISKVAGIFRAAPSSGYRGLTRDGGLSTFSRSYATYAPTLVTQPTVLVQLDGRQFDARIVKVVQGVLRERDRRNRGGYSE